MCSSCLLSFCVFDLSRLGQTESHELIWGSTTSEVFWRKVSFHRKLWWQKRPVCFYLKVDVRLKWSRRTRHYNQKPFWAKTGSSSDAPCLRWWSALSREEVFILVVKHTVFEKRGRLRMSSERVPSKSEVMGWNPQQLADYLRRVRPWPTFCFCRSWSVNWN